MNNNRGYISSLEIINKNKEYPFTIPTINNTSKIDFHNNGSGKSTILEAIAISLKINPEGGNRNTRFSILPTESSLNKHIIINKTTRAIKDAFFLRAETFFNLYIAAQQDEIENPGHSWGFHGYTELQNRSHGESHLDLIARKMTNGVYIFDEPESGLGIDRQMQFILEVHRLIQNGSQIIIATHSPIILSYPDSKILHLQDDGIFAVDFEDTKPYQLMKIFMNNHKRVINELLSDI
jgi:predicted ATPase